MRIPSLNSTKYLKAVKVIRIMSFLSSKYGESMKMDTEIISKNSVVAVKRDDLSEDSREIYHVKKVVNHHKKFGK